MKTGHQGITSRSLWQYCSWWKDGYCGGLSFLLFFVTISLVVIWNPWAQKAMTMSDFGDDEVCLHMYLHFVFNSSQTYVNCLFFSQFYYSILICCVWRLDMWASLLLFNQERSLRHNRPSNAAMHKPKLP